MLGEPRRKAGLREVLPARPAAAQQGVQPPDRVVEQHRVPGHAEHADAELIRYFKDNAQLPSLQILRPNTSAMPKTMLSTSSVRLGFASR